MMDRSFEGTVSGRVQGVGFRYFASEVAQELDIRGWTRNLPDGTVAFHAEGSGKDVEEFVQRLRQGPLCGRVDRLSGDWLPKAEGHLRFEIRG
jgi:acylphosphatase